MLLSNSPLASQVLVVVLAAGRGTRFLSDHPKAIQRAQGVHLIQHVLRSAGDLAAPIFVVIGHGAELVKESVGEICPTAVFFHQPEPLGTGDAVRRCRDALENFEGTVVVLPGDGPLLRAETIKTMVEEHERHDAAVSLVVGPIDDIKGYVKVKLDEHGFIEHPRSMKWGKPKRIDYL